MNPSGKPESTQLMHCEYRTDRFQVEGKEPEKRTRGEEQ